jgi:PAS domain S-box-containing protein
MAWTDHASSNELQLCIRDLVALSTLPATWQNYDIRQIGNSIISALISMLDADFVCVTLPVGNQLITEQTRNGSKVSPTDLRLVQTRLHREKPIHGQAVVFTQLSGGSDLHVVTAPIGTVADAMLAAGSIRSTFPTSSEKLLLNTGASQAGIALQQRLEEAEKNRFTTLVQRTTDFVGIASLRGEVQYVNPAGLQLVGLASLDDALKLHVVDFVSPQNRKAAQEELWPMVLRAGRWKGELELTHFGSGTSIPVLVDCFRIDDPRTGEPMNIATVSRDLSVQKHSEAALRQLNDNLERSVKERTSELAAANNRLVAEKLEREQTDLRLQKLQSELSDAARLAATAQMAAILAHELKEPLTALVNSANTAKRLLARGHRADFLIAQEVTGEAAEQALRASAIIDGLRQLVDRSKRKRTMEVLATIIEEAAALALSSIAPIVVRLTFEFDDKTRRVSVNRVQIQQVIVNLIRNAVEAMADQEPREITLTTSAVDDETIAVSVADIGPGIRDELADRLFKPFVSLKHDGMGLGLSICHSIIEAHDGQLIATPNPRGGTIFRFTLPSGGVPDGD